MFVLVTARAKSYSVEQFNSVRMCEIYSVHANGYRTMTVGRRNFGPKGNYLSEESRFLLVGCDPLSWGLGAWVLSEF